MEHSSISRHLKLVSEPESESIIAIRRIKWGKNQTFKIQTGEAFPCWEIRSLSLEEAAAKATNIVMGRFNDLDIIGFPRIPF